MGFPRRWCAALHSFHLLPLQHILHKHTFTVIWPAHPGTLGQLFACEYQTGLQCTPETSEPTSCACMQTDLVFETLRTNEQRAYIKTGATGHQNNSGQAAFVAGLDYQAFFTSAIADAHKSLQFEPTRALGSDMRAMCVPQFSLCRPDIAHQ